MKKMFLAVLMASVSVFAGLSVRDSDGVALGSAPYLKCSTGFSCTKVGDQIVITSSPSLVDAFTMANGEVFANSVDKTVQVKSNSSDASTTFRVYGNENSAAILSLQADDGDDANDKFSFNVSSDNSMSVFGSGDSTLSFRVQSSGDVTFSQALVSEGAFGLGTADVMTSGDATPAATGVSFLKSFSGNAVTITDFDGVIQPGHQLVIQSRGAVTFDVTSSGLFCGSTDIVSASGDMSKWIYDGQDWYCTGFIDQSDDLN